MTLRLSDVLKGVGRHAVVHRPATDIAFREIVHDSRLVEPGDLFVALRGERDGHAFVADARQRGAAGALVEMAVDITSTAEANGQGMVYVAVADTQRALQRLAHYWRKRHDVGVVGVTGSVGKTTTKEVIASVLSQVFLVLRNERNYNTEIGLPLSLLRLTAEHRWAVMEMGMYARGEIAALAKMAAPQIGVVTNVGPMHLERLGTIENIARAKGELVRALPADGWAVLNGDDPLVRKMRSRARAVYYGLGSSNDYQATDIHVDGFDGVRFTLRFAGQSIPLATPLLGKHNVYACLAAAAVGHIAGLSWEYITAGLASAPSTVRAVLVPGVGGSTIIDDTYNASPASVKAALDLLASLPGRKLAVLGDMLELGSYEEAGHRETGRRAAEVLDGLVGVGRRSRWTGEEARAQGLEDVTFCATNDEVAPEVRAGDTVLVKGSRGARMEEVVARLRDPGPARRQS